MLLKYVEKQAPELLFSFPFLFFWEQNQICLMSFGMKNDLYFFLPTIFYKNRAEGARKSTWQTNGYVQREVTISGEQKVAK